MLFPENSATCREDRALCEAGRLDWATLLKQLQTEISEMRTSRTSRRPKQSLIVLTAKYSSL
jgi:hypothetical protein